HIRTYVRLSSYRCPGPLLDPHSFPTRRSSDLILTYNGRSQKDNSERAPSVVLDALLNACVTTFTTGDTDAAADEHAVRHHFVVRDRKSTRLNSSHVKISYAVFCLKKKSVTNTQ